MATRGKTWSDDEVQVMLGIWGDASVQRQLKGTVRNSHVFDKIVKELASKGYQKTITDKRNSSYAILLSIAKVTIDTL